jgi:membrane-associated phospholipid phosphatase
VTQSPVDQQPDRDPRPDAARRRARRATAFAALAVAFFVFWKTIGLPTDATTIIAWLWLVTICWNIDRPPRYHLGFLRDWVPLALALVAYDVSRGRADNGHRPHVTEMIDADRWLFGGEVPTVWLQQHLYDPAAVHWWDAVASCVYFTHFVTAPAIAVVLWLRNRELWLKFIRRWLGLIVAGLATYFLYPAAPPWWAAVEGYIPDVQRISGRGWAAVGLHGAGNVMARLQELSNPVAAMPSLHAAFALLVAAFLFFRVPAKWRPLLAVYPVLMAATLVYTGEHWVVDAVVGWLYVAVVFAAVGLGERAWARWRVKGMPQAVTASANGKTNGAPASLSSLPTSAIVQPLSTTSSTSSTGPDSPATAAASSSESVNAPDNARTR